MSNYRRRLLLANQSEENIILYGNSVQDGTPTPDAPIDVMSVEDPTIKIRSNNLIKPSNEPGTVLTYGELTVTFNADGSITLNGTNDSNDTHPKVGTTEVTANTIYLLHNIPSSGSTLQLYTYYPKSETEQSSYIGTNSSSTKTMIPYINQTLPWRLTIKANATFDNLTIYPMLGEGTEVLPYEPYEEELITIDETTPFGKNWVTNDVYNINNWIRVGNGYGYYLDLPAGDYTASAEKKDNSSQFFYLQISTNDWTDFVTKHILLNASNNRVTFTVGENTKCRFYTTNSAFTNYIDSIQIEKGKYYTGYEPYVPPITSMRGIGNYKDRIYTKDGKVWFEQRAWCYKTSLGQKVYQNKITSLGLQFYTDNNIVDEKHRSLGRTALLEENNPGLSTHFTYNEKAYSAWGLSDTTAMIGARLWFLSDNFANQDAAQLWFNENQIEVIYPLLNPIVTEITGVLAEKILAIDKTKNITIYSDNGIYGNIEIIED